MREDERMRRTRGQGIAQLRADMRAVGLMGYLGWASSGFNLCGLLLPSLPFLLLGIPAVSEFPVAEQLSLFRP
jgi:hypothetical protein